MIANEWTKLIQRFQNIALHEFIVMPNHFHSIIEILDPVTAPVVVGATLVVAPSDVIVPPVINDAEARATTRVAPTESSPTESSPTESSPTKSSPTKSSPTKSSPTKSSPTESSPTESVAPTESVGQSEMNDSRATTRVAPTQMDEIIDRGAINSIDRDIPTDISIGEHQIQPNKSHTLGEMIGAFKSTTTVEYIRGVKNNGWKAFDGKLWQRDYFEHIVRDEKEYNRIADYIFNNPLHWDQDKFYT